MQPFYLCCVGALVVVAGVVTIMFYYTFQDINSDTVSDPSQTSTTNSSYFASELLGPTSSLLLPAFPSLPISHKRQEIDGLSLVASRFQTPYLTIARAELLAFQVPLPPPQAGGSIKVVEYYSEEAFHHEILHGNPVLFKNFYQRRPLIDPHHVRDTLGNMVIKVKTGNYGDPEYGNGDPHFHSNTQYVTTMKAYIDTVIDGGETRDGVIPYASNNKCDKECEEKMMGKNNSIQFPFYKRLRHEAKIWVSKAGTLTPLHRDTADNLIVQLWGQKEWTLFPVRKDIADRLYYNPTPVKGGGPERSLVNITHPDLEHFPAFDGVLEEFSFKATVEAGDLLFLPVGWGHEVYTATDSVMLNYWTSEPKSIYEHICYTMGRASSIMDLAYSEDNVRAQLPASRMLPISGLRVTGKGNNGIELKNHKPVGEHFTLIFDLELPEGSSGRLVSKTSADTVYWELEFTDCRSLKFQYTTVESETGSVEWTTSGSMCTGDGKTKHRIIVSVDGKKVTLTMDQEAFAEIDLEGLIGDCESSTPTSVSKLCTLFAGELHLPEGTEGRIPLAFVHLQKAL